MKSLKAGEKILAEFSGNCKYGNSTIFMTNLGLAIEGQTSPILEVGHGSIVSVQPTDKNKVKIVWKENDNTYDFEIIAKNAQSVSRRYTEIQKSFFAILERLGARPRQTTEEIVVESSVLSNPTISEPLVSDDTKIENSPENKRFVKIPSHVTDDKVWNDCWYDFKFDLYVTHNRYFCTEKLQNRPHQISYRLESGDQTGIVAKPSKVELKLGIPAVQVELNDGKKTWFLLPTMSESLLTPEIMTAKGQKFDYNVN